MSISLPPPIAKPWYLLSAAETARTIRVVPSQGLTRRAVEARRAEYGPNVVPPPVRRPAIFVFLDRFKDILVIFLCLAALASLALGHYADALIIAIAIILDTTLSFSQVWRTERTLARLRNREEPLTTSIRDGRAARVPASFLVPGDIIEFRAGEKIPADARIIHARGLRISEAILTGESRDVAKQPASLLSRTPLGNRTNMVYLGTTIVSGSGQAIVVATGTRTEMGKIALLLKAETSPPSPLRRKLHQTGIAMGWAIIVLVAAIAAISVLNGHSLATTVYTAITLIVSAIPEDLTVILTIALTVGMVRMLKKRGLVRELGSAETLGAATVICTDKTGTLTAGQMTAVTFDTLQGTLLAPNQTPSDPWLSLAMTGFCLASDAHRLQNSREYFGSATGRTALAFAEAAGFDQTKFQRQYRHLDSIDFSTTWKYRASLHDHPTQGGHVLFVAGAPEILLEKSSACVSTNLTRVRLSSALRRELLQRLHERAARGERLLAIAVRRNLHQNSITHADIADLTFLGVLVLTDPLRSEVRASLQEALRAGIAVKLVTGDYPATARAIALEAGLTATRDTICTGQQLAEMSDAELRDNISRISLFARVSPLDKQRIIRILQSQGHVVAMTGDGVNDAVALKSADIGVAMGSGKDIAKDAADLVLLDDSFATIVHAVREGRIIRDNVRKVIGFLLATNAAEVALFFISVIARLPLPLLPAQILWINLVTDGTSDIALSLEPAERNVMRRRPENPSDPLINKLLTTQIITTGLILTCATMALYWYLLRYLMLDLPYVRTMVFTFLALSALLSTWSFRSLTDSLFRRGLWQNPWILLSAGFSLLLQLAAIYFTPMQRIFGTVPLDAYDWMVLLVLATVTVILIDLRKAIRFKAKNAKRKMQNNNEKLKTILDLPLTRGNKGVAS